MANSVQCWKELENELSINTSIIPLSELTPEYYLPNKLHPSYQGSKAYFRGRKHGKLLQRKET